jgi:hypothetical protein
MFTGTIEPTPGAVGPIKPAAGFPVVNRKEKILYDGHEV